MFSNCGAGKDSESPLDCKEIKPVNPKGHQPWIFIGRTDAETETPILWPPDAKSWLIGKDPNAGKDWRQEEKGMTEDEMIGWHHQSKGHEFGQTLGGSEGQGSLACCNPYSHSQRVGLDWVIEQEEGRETFSLLRIGSSQVPSTWVSLKEEPVHMVMIWWVLRPLMEKTESRRWAAGTWASVVHSRATSQGGGSRNQSWLSCWEGSFCAALRTW